ncbi:ABC transporter permease [Paenibacillus macerans]|uniref:ABC transporter permease n=1 Tax=Paenibacillus macerans TaxID=44252 RepID=UPI003D310854
MLHLIRLELKKGRFSGYVWGALTAYLIMAALMATMYFVDAIEDNIFHGYAEMFTLIDTLVRVVFIVYAAVLISKLIIGEFKDKTIALLFAYPVNRKRLIFAKLSMVFAWTLANVILANLFVDAVFLALNSAVGYVTEPLEAELLARHGLNVLLQALGAAGMSLLPLAFGLRKKSVSTTIVSSILIVALVCSNNFGVSLSSIIAIPLSLSALGILLTYLSFRNIDRVDVG